MSNKNDDDLPKDLDKYFKASKSVESKQKHDLSGPRKTFVRRIFLNKYFLIIVLILAVVICVLLQGIKF